jgi:hypothetical protein
MKGLTLTTREQTKLLILNSILERRWSMREAAEVLGDLIRVWGFSDGVWRMYDPTDPTGTTLFGLVSGRGYWVKVSRDCTLIFRKLSAGWNNIGW